jgi:hypothetical protein
MIHPSLTSEPGITGPIPAGYEFAVIALPAGGGVKNCQVAVPEQNGPCIVAKCGHFRARKRHQTADMRWKWLVPEIAVPLFTEMLPYVPPGWATGGQNDLC